jgi:5,5'-dehydrodivanillate O-demethylase
MLTVEENELLTRVGPGTPMGELLRRYWQPICAADQLQNSMFRTHEVKVLGEELVLYRDRSGQLGLIDKYCVHRRASMAYGVVEQDGIRCQYHGWKYDHTGRCTEQPFEEVTHPEAHFKDRCGITAYPVQELGGLIFAYLGPQPAPLLPRWGPLVWDNCVHDIAIAHLPCSWLQCQENSLDSIHTEHLHGYAGRYFKELLAGEELTFERDRSHTKVGFEVFKHGIVKRRVVMGQDEEHPQWRLGHPILFPNILWVGSTLQFRVPQDDTHTLHISRYTWKAAPGTEAPRQDVIPSRLVPFMNEGGEFTGLDYTFNQDYMCWVTQGAVAQRQLEKLGASDEGIILFRNVLLDEVKRVQNGQEPSFNIFRDPEDNEGLEFPTIPNEAAELVGATRPGFGTGQYFPGEAGWSVDEDKINSTMSSWKGVDFGALAQSRR